MLTISDLRDEATNPNVLCSTLLTKALVIASQPQHDEMRAWIENELTGYTVMREIPEYRVVLGRLDGRTARGWQPVQIEDPEQLEKLSRIRIETPVGTLEEYGERLKEKGGVLHMGFPADQQRELQAIMSRPAELAIALQGPHVTRMLGAVRHKLVKWLIEISNASGGEPLPKVERIPMGPSAMASSPVEHDEPSTAGQSLSEQELLARITNHEDNFTERKINAQRAEIRQTLVAFANSVPKGHTAILFIGVADNGEISGVSNSDQTQKTVHEAADECYPSVPYTARVLTHEGKHIVAVAVGHSAERPHFAGAAYVRRGSSSKKATPEQYRELISSRHSPTNEILRWKQKTITVEMIDKKFGNNKRETSYHAAEGCRVEDCDQFTVTLYILGSQRTFTEPMKWVTISRDDANSRLKLIVQIV